MKGAFSAYTIVIVLVIAVSCDSADVTMQFAGENAIELQKLRTRYADRRDRGQVSVPIRFVRFVLSVVEKILNNNPNKANQE